MKQEKRQEFDGEGDQNPLILTEISSLLIFALLLRACCCSPSPLISPSLFFIPSFSFSLSSSLLFPHPSISRCTSHDAKEGNETADS
jgi:hypothetical protein